MASLAGREDFTTLWLEEVVAVVACWLHHVFLVDGELLWKCKAINSKISSGWRNWLTILYLYLLYSSLTWFTATEICKEKWQRSGTGICNPAGYHPVILSMSCYIFCSVWKVLQLIFFLIWEESKKILFAVWGLKRVFVEILFTLREHIN